MDDLKKNPEDEAKDNEIESPVDGPMPDWMRLATSGGSSSSLTEENTPAWLKSIRSGQGLSKDKPAEPAKQPSPPPSSAVQTSDDSMSDLERLLAEEGIDLGSVAEERPEGAGGMSARDWLIATSSEEIIRNKVGAQPMEKPAPPPVPTIPPSSTPPSPPQAIQTSDDSMSDLERLLAEEGIDLGSVAEERPEGAGSMSARDWLISTSGEEIIRNKLGVKPVEEPPALAPVPSTPPPSSPLVDDKMVVEEDLPDWLQEIAADSMEAEPSFAFDTTPLAESTSVAENDQFVVEDELPDWLQEVADETSGDIGGTVPVPSPEQVGATPAQDKMVAAEDLPDWLRDISEEPGVASEPEIPSVSAAPASFADDKMVVEEDLPDWLRDMAEEPAAPVEPTRPFTQTPPTTPADDGLVVEEDLPDWLREAAEPAAADLPAADWPTLTTANADKMVVQEDLPDWLQEIAEEPTLTPEIDVAELATPAPPSESEDKVVAEEDLPDWLREAATDSVTSPEPDLPPAFSIPTTADKMIVEEDLPDWLREVEIGGSESEITSAPTEPDRVVAELEETEGDEDLPDWLREVEVSSLEDNLALPLMKPAAETSSETDFALNTPLGDEDLDLLNEEDLPAWLKEVQERNGQEPSNVPSQPITPSADSFGLVVEEELPDWLRDAQEETTPLAFEELEPAAQEELRPGEEDLPDWLREERFDIDEPFEASEPSPEPLVESDLVVAEELPDWLQEVQDETPEETPFAEETPAPVVSPARLDTDEMVDQEGLPDWLREAAEEEVEPLPEEALAPTPQPVAVVSETVIGVTEVTEEIPSAEVVAAIETAPVSQPETAPAPISEPVSMAETSGAIPDWLQKLRQVDEEEIMPVPFAPVPVVPAPLPVPVAVAKAAPQPVYAPAPVVTAPPPPDVPADAEERLKRARTARDKGDISEAVSIYDSLVAHGVYLDKIIEDMQQTIKAQPGNYLLYQLMGDAMMRDGRLQSALNAYREALSKL